MASGLIKFATLRLALFTILISECAAWVTVQYSDLKPLTVIGLVRMVQIGGVLIGICHIQKTLTVVGLSLTTWRRGIINGLLWSIAFGVLVIMSMGVINLMGHNPINLVRSPLPSGPNQPLLFFLIGGLISPIAEEICFRGVLYSYFRRWGVVPAILISSIIFTSLHSFHGFPAIQTVGAVLFAISFELSKSLLVPIVIHIISNLAIFMLSLPYISG